MYTQGEYLYGWLLYLLGAVLLIGCVWWMSRGWRSGEVRQLVRLGSIVFFLVPWQASPDLDYLAPAWIIAGFEGVFDGAEAFWRAGAPLLVCLGVAMVVSLIWHLVYRYRAR